MISTTLVPCSPSQRRDIVTLLACFVVVLLTTLGLSAQTTQPTAAKATKTSKKAKAASSSKSTPVATAKKTEKLPLHTSRYAIKQQAETALDDNASENSTKFETPDAAAQEAYAARAYPAPYIPQQLTLAARDGWVNFKSADAKRPKAPGEIKQWTLVPLNTAEFPRVLTFAGQPYYDSGRVTALAISSTCQPGNCRLWMAAAGGGIWRTDDALATNGPTWTFVSGSFATNAIGALTYDANTNTLYAGTGEANASSDSEAGFGIYKSTDGGDNWTALAGTTSVASGTVDCTAVLGTGGVQTAPAYSGPAFNGRAISSIVINGSTIYVGSTRAVRGVSAVSSGGAVSLAPGLPPYGMWKSTDGGATFTLLEVETACLNPTLPNAAGIIQTSFGSTRGVNHIELDPSNSSIVYAAAFPRNNALPVNTGGGIWRSNDGGATWNQIYAALNPTQNTDRSEFAVTLLPAGTTRMYVGDGNAGTNNAVFKRSDDVANGTPVYTDLTTTQNIAYCTAQCWYDNFVVSPAGYPDTVYLGGSFSYNESGNVSDARGVVYSTDAGNSFTDMTWDATFKPTPAGSCCQKNPVAPNGIHPDQHALVVSPSNPALFFEGSDGGLMRSSGTFSDISGQCSTYRALSGAGLALCQQLLSRVPTTLYSLNRGLTTLQFQGISIDPHNPRIVQGGTQDNGTWQTLYPAGIWSQIIYGDGGQSGFSATNSNLRFNTFTGKANDGNFQNGDPTKWVILSGPIFASSEGSQFYPPVIADPNPAAGQTIFQGSNSVWRTQDWGGNQLFLETNCPEFTTSAANPNCGDFVQIGPSGKTSLVASNATDYRGTTRSGGNVAAIQRTLSDTGTMWAATTTGRVFISKNADNPTANAVTYARLDNMPSATASPGRFVSGIYIDPANANHAWISYSSYSSLTPATPGHIFSVLYDPTANGGLGDATWTNLDGSGGTAFPDFPATSITWDPLFGIFASNDWGVLRLPLGSSNWQVAGVGLPMVEITDLKIVPSARRLYAATHGRNVWYLQLN